ncbi:hypothetical protein EX895_000569 [Sporisorium graminicola]|uniref:Uncharacterized protein n=1 Tax=Sporisorium graminicola TaxID=280036 RepID=A0A4U7L051_9BASI|nr:hypothetical protein EX895_000569 [Sporisorium graminicola]TKY90571.1 hypothetical protein EX895_000569 [Sporisorium graminicola]
MAQPGDSTAAATKHAATRNRADTGASLSAPPFGTSYRSAAGSSVISNGSLLDLYARSPGSFPESLQSDIAFSSNPGAPTAEQPLVSAVSSNGMPMTPTARGFQTASQDASTSTPGFFMPPSDSNASIWTTASASATDSLPQSKRASVAGFDVDAIRSVQPAHDIPASDTAAVDLPPPPRIGVAAPQEDSDGSHYDEDEVPDHDSFDQSADRTAEPSAARKSNAANENDRDGEQVFTNALPSPPVPRRTSSVMQDTFNISPSPSLGESMARTASSTTRHAASRSGSGQLVADQIPHRWSSAEFRDDAPAKHPSRQAASPDRGPSSSQPSPTKGTLLPVVNEKAGLLAQGKAASSRSSHEPSLDEQIRLEKELLAETDASRPRTLKEARERAKLRRQQTDTASPPSTAAPTKEPSAAMSSNPRQGASLHVRDVASSMNVTAVDDNGSRSSIDSKDRPLRNPKRVSNREGSLAADRRSLSERSAPSDYSHSSSGAEGAFTYDEPAALASRYLSTAAEQDQQATSMDDLTDAVDSAMNDLSFGDGDETLSANEEFSTPMPPPKPQDDARPQIPTSLPSARSLASITGVLPNDATDAVRSSPLASPARFTTHTPKSTFFPSGASHSLSTPPLGSPVHQRTAQVPSAPQQRSGPAVPSRIDVYGKTLPMPKAFASSGIIVDKKRKSSWERAGTYARYTNELLHLQTGLSLWMEAVQRPAMRQQQNSRPNQAKQTDDWLAQGTLPRSMHVRNEGSYADSVRSDMTFPMRGDGAKAKEIVSIMPTMAESSPVRSPINLPYPGVVAQQQQPPRSNSTQSFVSVPASLSNADSLAGVGNSSRGSGLGGGGNRFFGGLGRKGSKRTQPSAPVPSVPAASPLSSAAAAVGGSRAYLANNRASRGTSPGAPGGAAAGVASGYLSSARQSTDTFETSHSSQSRPESPATGPVRVSGLGLGGSSGEVVSSPLASSSTGRLDSVAETKVNSALRSTPIAPGASGTTGLRAPLGPRAPNSNPRHPQDMSRIGSGHSQTAGSTGAAPITPVTPVTPITPITGAFGSGPTFVSRLGGGSFSSSAGGGHTSRSPGREGYSSPDFLPVPTRRTSDLSGLSPASPPLSSATSHDAASSPRLGAGLRSSFSYGSVRDRIRRGSDTGTDDEAFQAALTKLGDILPDADEQTLRYYLKKAKGNDLTAIGDYLQDQSLGKLPRF